MRNCIKALGQLIPTGLMGFFVLKIMESTNDGNVVSSMWIDLMCIDCTFVG